MSEQLNSKSQQEGPVQSPESWLLEEYKTRWKKSFDKLNESQTKNDKFQKLQDFGRRVPALIEEMSHPVGMTQTLIDIALAGLPEDEIKVLLDDVISDVRTETEYLKELEDTGIAAALTAQSIEQGTFTGTLEWVEPGSRLHTERKQNGILGEYNVRFHRARVFDKIPTPREILTLLARSGRLPGSISTLEHELAHALQYSEASLLERVREKYGNDELLDELHAFVAEGTAAPFRDVTLDQPDEIGEFVFNEYEINHVDKVTAVKACKRIMMLKLLGYDDRKLGNLITIAKYDQKTRSYPLLDQTIQEELATDGIRDSKDIAVYMNALLAKHEIELQYNRHKAMSIAAKRLASLVRNPSWDQTKQMSNS